MGEQERDPVAQVKSLWEAFAVGGMEAVVALVDEDVEFRPLGAEGEVLRGGEELARWFEGLAERERQQSAHAFHYEQAGEHVIVTGSLRQWQDGGFSDLQPAWLYRFAGGRLRSMRAYETLADARAAAAQD